MHGQQGEAAIELTNKTGVVWHKRRDVAAEIRVQPNVPLYLQDTIRTDTNSTAVVLVRRNHRLVRLWELTTLRIEPSDDDPRPWLSLLRGALYLFSREKSNEVRIRTPHATGAPFGTEFLIMVESNQTMLAMFDGTAVFSNAWGSSVLESGELGVARTGAAPIKTSLEATNLIQWWLYYPTVLDTDEVLFTPEELRSLAPSIETYRSGNLRKALLAYPGYPSPPEPATDPMRLYLAALYLGAGHVDKAQALLAKLDVPSSQAASLRWLIDAVQGNIMKPPRVNTSASEWLGLSYYHQARHELKEALIAATNALARSPQFGAAWLRVAELEFGFGHTRKATAALTNALTLAPEIAQAHALGGFLFAAENRLGDAQKAFEKAIQIDPSLGNAWLGLGLVRIRLRDSERGRMDLQMAAILEPRRSLVRSYLGKAFGDAGDDATALMEFQRAKGLDTNDPTPFLYSALVLQQDNQINNAITNLERSISLNDNRRLYRSRLLLDEDKAVRGANLASIYRDAGMTQVSVREAARAVSYDYANYSAHLFLSESHDALRDPTRFNLRHETVWFNELLLANLLSPVGGTPLSQHISQNEYSRLFEQNRIGLSSSTEYRSDGQFHQLASQFGNVGDFGWSLDLDYHRNTGVRPNNDLDSIEWYSTVKQQITAQDSVLLLAKYQDYHSGDNSQHYEPTNASRSFRFDEYQAPIIVGGYHREWAPGSHTLFLGGRLESEQRFKSKEVGQTLLRRDSEGEVFRIEQPFMDVKYKGEFEIYTAELNQILQRENRTLVGGARFQAGTFDTEDLLTLAASMPTNFSRFFRNPPASIKTSDDFERMTAYGYYTYQIPGPFDDLLATAGFSYDRLVFPRNHRSPPISHGEITRDQFNPKAAFVCSPSEFVTLRGAYTHSLGGVSFDESFRLEPTQLGGFSQSYRSIISESLVGSVSAPTYQTAGAAIDIKLPTHTYFGFEAEFLRSEVRREAGVFNRAFGSNTNLPSITPEHLDYEQQSVLATVNQLLSQEWALGAEYRFTVSELHTRFPGIPSRVDGVSRTERADLHQLTLSVLFNHPSGLFARAETQWYHQKNFGYAPERVEEDFFQHNLFVGYRFLRRQAEISAGILNLTGEDYRLNPLTPYSELPRERVFVVRMEINL